MPIPNKYRAAELEGRYVVADKDIETRDGHCIRKSSPLRIRSANYGLELVHEACPHCGQYFFVRRVKRDCVTLVEDDGTEFVNRTNTSSAAHITILRAQAEVAMKRMREILDEAAYAADTPEDEAVVEFGWELYDIFKNSLESDKHS